MGIVLKARDERLGRAVALKILRPELAEDGKALERFKREAKAIGALRHPNILTVYAVGEEQGVQYLVMEYIDGPTLADVIDRQAPLPTETIRRLMNDLISGLEAAHRAGLIHRDIKSANLLLDGWPVGAGLCQASEEARVELRSRLVSSRSGPTRPGSEADTARL